MMTKQEQDSIRKLVEDLRVHVWEGITSDDATPHLEWLGKQDPELVKKAIIATQPRGWVKLIGPLVDDMTHDKRVGLLAAIIAVYVQAQAQSQSKG